VAGSVLSLTPLALFGAAFYTNHCARGRGVSGCGRAWRRRELLALARLLSLPPGTSNTCIYLSLFFGSLLIVLPQLLPVSTRLCWATFVAVLATAQQLGADFPLSFAPRIAFASVLGTAAAVLAVLPPWPGSRAGEATAAALADASAAAGDALCALAALLAPGALCGPDGEEREGLLRVRAAAAAAAAARSRAAAEAHLPHVWWEGGGTAPPPRLALLRRLELGAAGQALALAAQREEDARQAELRAACARSGGGGGGDAVGRALEPLRAAQTALLDTYCQGAARMDGMLAGPAARLAAAAAAALRAPAAAAAAAAEALHEQLADFDGAVTVARRELFYADAAAGRAEGPSAEAQARLEAVLSAHGPRTGRYLAVFCLRDAAWALLEEGAGGPAPAEPAAPPRGPAALLRQLGLPPSAARWTYALKLVVACVAALATGRAMCGSGLWSALSVSFIGPREHSTLHSGGSFHTASLRLAGTVAGALYGFFVYAFVDALPAVAGGEQGRTGLAMLLLAAGVFFLGLLRHSPRHAYGVIVAQFTPYMMADPLPTGAADVSGRPSAWAYRRVEQNLVGVLFFVLVELLVSPRRAALALRRESSAALQAGASAARAVWEAQAAAGGGACAACRARAHAAVAGRCAALGRSVRLQGEQLAELADEEDWAPLSAAAGVAAPPPRAVARLVEEQGEMERLLSLAHAALEAAARARGEASQAARLFGPCAPALHALLQRLHDRYAALGAQLAVGGPPGAAAAASARAARLTDAAHAAFQARTASAFVGLLRSHRRREVPPIPSDVVVPFLALTLCARLLARNAHRLAAAVAEVTEGEGDGAGGEEDEEAAETATQPPPGAEEAPQADTCCPLCGMPTAEDDGWALWKGEDEDLVRSLRSRRHFSAALTPGGNQSSGL